MPVCIVNASLFFSPLVRLRIYPSQKEKFRNLKNDGREIALIFHLEPCRRVPCNAALNDALI